MKVTIYGTGAVGGTIGSILANAGHEMTFIARGEHLKKMQEWGLQMVTPDGRQTIHGHFTNLLTTVDTPDYLFLCVKAFSLPEIEEGVNRITGPGTIIIPVINGIPFWHFHGMQGDLKDWVPTSLDPKGNMEKFFPYENLIGSVIYMTGSVEEPGVISNYKHPPKFFVGEIDRKKSDRLSKLTTLLEEAGFKRPESENIRIEVWRKLCWNIAFNPISALTGMTSAEIVEDKDTREAGVLLMRETEEIFTKLEIPFKLDIEQVMEIARKSGSHKPSMLQDVENGKKLETESIVGVLVEIADKLDIPCPRITQLYTKMKDLEAKLSAK